MCFFFGEWLLFLARRGFLFVALREWFSIFGHSVFFSFFSEGWGERTSFWRSEVVPCCLGEKHS